MSTEPEQKSFGKIMKSPKYHELIDAENLIYLSTFADMCCKKSVISYYKKKISKKYGQEIDEEDDTFEYFEKLSKLDDADGLFWMGCYYYIVDLNQNFDICVNYFQKSFEKGSKHANLALLICYIEGTEFFGFSEKNEKMEQCMKIAILEKDYKCIIFAKSAKFTEGKYSILAAETGSIEGIYFLLKEYSGELIKQAVDFGVGNVTKLEMYGKMIFYYNKVIELNFRNFSIVCSRLIYNFFIKLACYRFNMAGLPNFELFSKISNNKLQDGNFLFRNTMKIIKNAAMLNDCKSILIFGYINFMRGNYEEAIKYYNLCEKLGHDDVIIYLIKYYCHFDDINNIEKIYGKVTLKNKFLLDKVNYCIGNYYLRKGNEKFLEYFICSIYEREFILPKILKYFIEKQDLDNALKYYLKYSTEKFRKQNPSKYIHSEILPKYYEIDNIPVKISGNTMEDYILMILDQTENFALCSKFGEVYGRYPIWYKEFINIHSIVEAYNSTIRQRTLKPANFTKFRIVFYTISLLVLLIFLKLITLWL